MNLWSCKVVVFEKTTTTTTTKKPQYIEYTCYRSSDDCTYNYKEPMIYKSEKSRVERDFLGHFEALLEKLISFTVKTQISKI